MNHLRQQIAQMLCFGFSGHGFENNQELQDILTSHDGIGALILFDYDCHTKTQGKNITSFEQVKQLNHDIKTFYASKHPGNGSIWLAIDLEGGRVDRLKNCPEYPGLPSAHEMSVYPNEKRLRLWQENASLIKQLGFDINFAPVVDLNLSPNEGIFGPLDRCFSSNPKDVAHFALEFLSIYRQEGVLGCIKHYPGHGSARGDSHHGFVDVTDTFSAEELIPYQLLLQSQHLVPMIMTAHVINRQLDPLGFPATLSTEILGRQLRGNLNYQGIIISDDLQMHAIASYYGLEEALIKTIQAGADMIIFGNQLGHHYVKDIIDLIEALVLDQKIDRQCIEKAYQRIMTLKKA